MPTRSSPLDANQTDTGLKGFWQRIFPGAATAARLRHALANIHDELCALAEAHQLTRAELQSANEGRDAAESALAEADMRRQVFLATLSHELRNPLAPIRTAARLLESSNLNGAQVTRAQSIISRQVTHMSSLLDDLLDVARITRGAFLLKKACVGIDTVMEAAVEAVQAGVDAKHHTLCVERRSTLIVEVDPIRLTQVISNLLTNAIKYTPPGGLITLGCRPEAHAVVIFVRDNGVGLAAEMLNAVFDMFTRIESGPNHSEGGLGIGLALAKGLAELHGGRLRAKSAGLGQGSEFTVSLPSSLIVEQPDRGAEPRALGPNHPARRILIADDNRDGAESLGLYLEMLGHEVHVAYTGTEALALAATVQPEVGVIDIGMPDMNGYELAARIRRQAWGERVTLIALTGWGQDSDKCRARAAGFDHHCTKPVDPAALERYFTRADPKRRELAG
jgi:signal transduction histidine kinase/ActR/RegA family two-component response regulator